MGRWLAVVTLFGALVEASPGGGRVGALSEVL